MSNEVRRMKSQTDISQLELGQTSTAKQCQWTIETVSYFFENLTVWTNIHCLGWIRPQLPSIVTDCE